MSSNTDPSSDCPKDRSYCCVLSGKIEAYKDINCDIQTVKLTKFQNNLSDLKAQQQSLCCNFPNNTDNTKKTEDAKQKEETDISFYPFSSDPRYFSDRTFYDNNFYSTQPTSNVITYDDVSAYCDWNVHE